MHVIHKLKAISQTHTSFQQEDNTFNGKGSLVTVEK